MKCIIASFMKIELNERERALIEESLIQVSKAPGVAREQMLELLLLSNKLVIKPQVKEEKAKKE